MRGAPLFLILLGLACGTCRALPRKAQACSNSPIYNAEQWILPVPISMPQPPYTQEARADRVQGTMSWTAVVGCDGKILHMHEDTKPLGHALEDGARRALKQWTFKPARRKGQPVAVRLHIEVDYRLRNSQQGKELPSTAKQEQAAAGPARPGKPIVLLTVPLAGHGKRKKKWLKTFKRAGCFQIVTSPLKAYDYRVTISGIPPKTKDKGIFIGAGLAPYPVWETITDKKGTVAYHKGFPSHREYGHALKYAERHICQHP